MSADRADGSTPRWRLDIAYDGHGLLRLGRARTGCVRCRASWRPGSPGCCGSTSRSALVCAGRTDAGVHARGQVAHVDLPATAWSPTTERSCTAGSPGCCPTTSSYAGVSSPRPGFDARFAAVWRRYVYRLSDAATSAGPAAARHQVTRCATTLDLDRLNAAAPTLLGLRDFGAFCRRRDGATTIRTLLELRGRRVADGPLAGVIECTVRADAFCHSMVRSLVGALVAVGAGRRDLAWLAAVHRARRSRDSAVPVMPARRADAGGGRLPGRRRSWPPGSREARSRERAEHDVARASATTSPPRPTGPEHRRTITARVWGRRARR